MRLWLALLLLLSTAAPSLGPAGLAWAAAAETPASQSTAVDIEVFVREGCPHCAKAEEFLAALKGERPELRLSIRDISKEPEALARLQQIAKEHGGAPRVPAFFLRGQLVVGYSDEATSGQLIRNLLASKRGGVPAAGPGGEAGSCEAVESISCEGGAEAAATTQEHYEIDFLGRKLSVEHVGLPLFTLAMGLLDGFNPCSMWVLLLMISLLAPMGRRGRMLAIAGTFVAVEGIAYFVFMAAWLNLFLFIGLSRLSELAIAAIALFAGAVNLKDFFAYGRGISLSIPDSAKPGIYARMRRILQAESLVGAVVGAVVLAVLVQIVEFLCTSGFPALFTRILTLHGLNTWTYYGYLLLYNAAYMLDDVIILGIGVYTLSQHRLQEREGRWLKFISGLVMVGLGIYLVLR
ncbi:glutaredoxin [Methylococcus sp. EFPC2]|uniref:glutaredoxin family protein n=1 Tax=Methylococcus sp. EFPC2 TaxID=2812648 RepID=UPI001967ED8B|nr:glutaredoxin [Methylococcus sp. EFPC2]QSA98449.1 glutaredoxin [Methylococcus sp. EFPC2]